MEYKVSWAVYPGTRHLREEIPCQDCAVVLRREETVCCALADGAGSRSRSELGADCVTQTVAALLSEHFEELWAMEEAALSAMVIDHCVKALGELEPPIYELACTLLFCAAHRDGRYLAGHLGDGVMIQEEDGELSVFSPPENGEYQNETYFITGPDAREHLRIRRGCWTEAGALLVMSDGTAESLYHYADGVPAAACRTLAAWLRNGEEDVISQALQSNLEHTFSRHTSDDMSLILLAWQECWENADSDDENITEEAEDQTDPEGEPDPAGDGDPMDPEGETETAGSEAWELLGEMSVPLEVENWDILEGPEIPNGDMDWGVSGAQAGSDQCEVQKNAESGSAPLKEE